MSSFQDTHREMQQGRIARPQLDLVRSRSRYERWIKPVFDRVLGMILLVALTPVLLVTGFLVRLFIGKPVFYRQVRIGAGGEPFELYKLRTMLPDRRVAELPYVGPERRVVHKSKRDPRVLPVGSALRSLRLDEVPQIWNVVKGDMSLVGPRPELPEIVSSYEDWQHRRHAVKPGMTGLWQVSDRNGLPMHECTDLDIDYLSQVSLGTDLSILARTPWAMVRRSGY